MTRLLRNSKVFLASAVLTVSTLGVAATSPSAAHAAPLSPTVTTSVSYSGSPEQATLDIQGVNFTPSGSVLVEVFNSSWHLVWSTTVTATPLTCRYVPSVLTVLCSGGAFAADYWLVQLPPTTQTYYAIAFDYSSGHWSNWSQQSII